MIPLLEDQDGAPYPEDVQRLYGALVKINRLRSNVVATQNCSWSNTTYPLVAILDAAGFDLEGATDDQRIEHLRCYGGAGGVPALFDHPEYVSRLDDPRGARRISGATGKVLSQVNQFVGVGLDEGETAPPQQIQVTLLWAPGDNDARD